MSDVFFPLHITAQNAGLIITQNKDSVVLEPFELSPTNEAVMSTVGRLQRCFPGSAISIPVKKFHENGFIEALAHTIETMSHQEVIEAKPKIVKKDEIHIEERDTTDPFLVTDYLGTVLLAQGGKAIQASSISKNTRDEVIWKDCLMPWRRSPVWLLIRVTLQLHFERLHSDRLLYKEFMIFLMTYTLDIAQKRRFPSDIIYCMMAKIARRLNKLGDDAEIPWIRNIYETLRQARACLRQRWASISRKADANVNLKKLSGKLLPTEGLEPYPEMDKLICSIGSRQNEKCISQFKAPWLLRKYDKLSIPDLQNLADESISFHLAAFEKWVESSLRLWILEVDGNACSQLYTSARSYYTLSQTCYSGCPESLSIAALTILELWIVCDESACGQLPLIQEYSPQIPVGILESLLLHSQSHLVRLARVEEYVNERCSGTLDGSTSIFSSFGQRNSFSVRYYTTSTGHQTLRRHIEEIAAEERKQKRKEFYKKRQEYHDLTSRSAKLQCEFNKYEDRRTGRVSLEHSGNCRSHELRRKADALMIQVHEWPLPASELEAQSVVFELDVPPCFSAWRNMTTLIINEVLECDYSGARPDNVVDRLSSYLSSHFRGNVYRLELVSTVKSNNRTHRNGKKIKTCDKEEDVLFQNGLRYEYYDIHCQSFVSSFINKDKRFSRRHMFKLSQQNNALQDFIFRPHGQENGLTPNHVLSQQSHYSQDLSLEESKAMASQPVGFRLGWHNILVQLFTPTVDLNKKDTVFIIMQIIHQAGPPDNYSMHRAGHQQLRDEAFFEKLLQGLYNSVDRIQKNWESYIALRLFIAIAIKALNFSPTESLIDAYRQFLGQCRSVVMSWVNLLEEKVPEIEDEKQQQDFHLIISQMAMICIASFDVDEQHMKAILLDDHQVKILLHSSIIIKKLSHSVGECTDPFYTNLVLQKQRVLYNSHGFILHETLDKGNQGLDSAVMTFPFYDGKGGWKSLSGPEYHWLVTEILDNNGQLSAFIQMNILTGELLVNGLPPSRLPGIYEKHPVFKALFGRVMIEVMPSGIPGTAFSSMKKYHGYNLSFGMDHSNPPQLILVASTDNETLDLIPRRALNDNLPVSFIHDFVHWYNRQSGKVEFRPTGSAWSSSNLDWYLENTGSAWALKRPGQTLICPTSSTIKRICHILRPLEEETHIHIIRDNTTSALNINLPRLRLDFSLQQDSSKIHCRQFRGMYVDRVQQIGTLVGLQSKLTLRDDQNRRKVLLLNGNAYYSSFSGHVRVGATYDSSVRVHPFDIDTRIGRLVDNGSLQSKLCLAYFHALTSYCLPDELTGKTGTEQCLSILNSAAVRSFQQLSEKDFDILAHISRLSPGRAYYPENERVMEKIDWDDRLSFLSQAGSLHSSVQSIIEEVNQNGLFHSGQPAEHIIPNHVDDTLGSRHRIRDSSFCVFGFGAESHSTSQDVRYKSRDSVKRIERSRRAFEIATMVVERRATIHMPINPTFNMDMWNLISNVFGTQGPNTPLPDKEVGYDCRWLSEANLVFSDYWCRFHHSFRNKGQSFCRFRLMFCLATMAYAEKQDISAVQALAACANIPRIRSIAVPTVDVFDTSKGFHCNTSDIKDSVDRNLVPFVRSQEASLSRLYGEDDRELGERRWGAFLTNQQAAVKDFVSRLEGQWICRLPLMPDGTEISNYVYAPDAMDHILPIWQQWYENHQLFTYLTALGDSLRLLKVKKIPRPSYTNPLSSPSSVSRRAFINQEDLFDFAPPSLNISSDSQVELLETQIADQQSHDKLKQLIGFLKQHAAREFEHKYLQDLDDSQKSHRRTITSYIPKESGVRLSDTLEAHLSICVANNDKMYCLLKEATGMNWEASVDTIQACTPSSAARQFMAPRISPSFFLSQLARENWKTLSLGWKRAVVTYAQSLTVVQRAERMLSQRDNETELIKELLNTGHTNWDPMDYPESLLLEVESGIMIREVQENIASQMRSPPQDENATMQLNMGEGKSTIIVPIVAAYLADGTRLIIIIVTKPQAKELFRMLVSKLGGLMNHQVYQMPFSRSLKLTASDASTILQILRKCSKTGGILLMQPEHLLSFKLMGIESQIASRGEVGQILLDAQHYFNNHSRCIVDESDEIFSFKFELIYTMGTQKSIELSPHRWIIIQRVLGIVMRAVESVRDEFPQSIEISYSKKGQFPRIRILRQDAEDKLLSELVEEICNTGVPGFPIMRQPEAVRECVREYILNDTLNISQINSVEVYSGFFTESIKGPLLLIRGLLAKGILSFAFRQKRWRVNYGLDVNRVPKTRLAIPYRAKDNPSARSEFSHPDVVIVLTCLTYYYGGLSNDDLFTAFDHLLLADQAEAQYQEWVQDAPQLPNSFRSLAGVTMKDRHQAIHDIFPHFRLAKNAIDYFLAHIVFAKEMKEFPLKLSASGWDIGQRKAHPTTGFSGTCDSRGLMPLDMKYLDLPEQRHTNALVLQYLLQPENSVAYIQKVNGAQNSDAEVLLNLVVSMEPPVQVILDVGAQILELDNAQVAAAWLKRVPESQGKKAVVYFNNRDELCVIDQQGCVESLQTSPYNQQLDLCLVFLDEAHTRGTDLKLPANYRAAVTLGPGLNKDRLVQGKYRSSNQSWL
jgi:hypothetical protein